MKIRSVPVLAAMALSLALATDAAARQVTSGLSNHKTVVTFNQPVEIPGRVLPAGTYTFQLAEGTPTNRHIVQVFDANGSKIVATIMAVADTRAVPTDDPIVKFQETKAGDPQALRGWYYQGQTTGDAFVYPATRASALAAMSNDTVPSMPDSSMADVSKSSASTIAVTQASPGAASSTRPKASTTQPMMKSTTTMPPTPATSSAGSTMSTMANPNSQTTPRQGSTVTAQSSVQPTDPTTPRGELPQSASSTPLLALLGLSAILAGAGLARWGRAASR